MANKTKKMRKQLKKLVKKAVDETPLPKDDSTVQEVSEQPSQTAKVVSIKENTVSQTTQKQDATKNDEKEDTKEKNDTETKVEEPNNEEKKNEPIDWNKDVEMLDHFVTKMKYEDLDICDNLKKGLMEMGFKNLSQIQAKSIPPLMTGKDILAQAKTGSGKTLAFLIPAIELLYRAQFKARNGTGVIIVSPTRELAIQIYSVAKELMKYMTQTHTCIIGGTNKYYESDKLQRGANLVVATPGRLLDHLMNTKFNYSNLILLALDEADRILDVGFEVELKAILRILPKKKRQTMLFSATQTTKVGDIARLSLTGTPVCVGVTTDDEENKKILQTADKLEQGYILTKAPKKFQLLFSFLKKYSKKKIIVFLSTCKSVKFHAELLNYIGIPVLDLHGKQAQNKRTNIFFNFCNAKSGILLCTDVAARGLDIPEVDWIVQYDPPENPREYIHRVGRTARAGKKGKALLFLLNSESRYLNHLKIAGVPLNELEFKNKFLLNIQSKLENIINTNYYLNQKATDAFKSYIASYSMHQLKDSFNFKTLDVEGVAKSMGLTTVPYVNLKALESGVSRKALGKRQKDEKSWENQPKSKKAKK